MREGRSPKDQALLLNPLHTSWINIAISLFKFSISSRVSNLRRCLCSCSCLCSCLCSFINPWPLTPSLLRRVSINLHNVWIRIKRVFQVICEQFERILPLRLSKPLHLKLLPRATLFALIRLRKLIIDIPPHGSLLPHTGGML